MKRVKRRPLPAERKKRPKSHGKQKRRRRSNSPPHPDILSQAIGHALFLFVKQFIPTLNVEPKQSKQPKQKQLEADNVIDITDYKIS